MLVLPFCLGHVAQYRFAQASSSPRAVLDTEDGRFRFLIDGKEVARFAADGLHIRDDIAYGGVITDVGVANFGIRAEGTR